MLPAHPTFPAFAPGIPPLPNTNPAAIAYEILVKQADRDKAIKRLKTDHNLKAAGIRLTRAAD